MGIILLFIGAILFMSFIPYIFTAVWSYDKSKKDKNCFIGFLWGIGIFSITTFSIFIFSYVSYINLKGTQVTISQYQDSIKLYNDYATLNIDNIKSSLTDFKYQGYQEKNAEFIQNLLYKVAKYNKSLTMKRANNDSFFFNVLIIAPDDDMKVIKLINK